MANRVVSILGCGWLGKPLGKSLANSGFTVMGSTTKDENISLLKAADIIPFVFTIGQPFPEEYIHQFFNCDVLIVSLPQGSRAGNVEGYLNMVQEVIRISSKATVRHILLISTTSVYPNLSRVVQEDDADTDNTIVKAEFVIRNSGIPNSIIRFAGLFGPGRHPATFLAGKRGISGGNIPVNMIHLEDCISIIKSVIQQNAWNEVLNACADDHPTRKEFYTKAAIRLGLEPPVFLDDSAVDFKIVSNERLKALLNYTFIHRLN